MEDGASGPITLLVPLTVGVDSKIKPEPVPTQLHLTEELIAMEVKRKS